MSFVRPALALPLVASLALMTPATWSLDAYDAVDPRIGARKSTAGVSGNGNTYYDAAAPFGMLQVGPDDQTATISNFPGFHLVNVSGPGAPMGGGCRWLAVAGDPGAAAPTAAVYTLVDASPGRLTGTVTFDQVPLTVDIAARQRYAVVRLSRPGSGPITVYGLTPDTVVTANTLAGSGPFTTDSTNNTVYYAARADREGRPLGTSITFPEVTEVTLTFAVSPAQLSGAQASLPVGDPIFADEAAAARQTWVDELAAISLDPSTSDAETTKFYTALYHMLLHPGVCQDVDGTYRKFRLSTNGTAPAGRTMYGHFSSWDTYRVHAPFLALLKPRMATDMAWSLLQDSKDAATAFGKWKLWAREANYMSGNPQALISAWTWLLTGGDFDISPAEFAKYRQRSNLTSSIEYPSPESEHGAANFTLKRLAERLGYTADAAALDALSQRWWSLWNAAGSPAGIYPKRSGAFITSGYSHGAGDTADFEESSWADGQWQFPWDLAKVVELHGGPAAAKAKFDTYFTNWTWVGKSSPEPFKAYNQPVHHMPWIAGQFGGAKEQAERVKGVITTNFLVDPIPTALPGNDDLGATSGWLVWSMLGLYPVWPGVDALAVNPPSFASATVTFAGKTLNITRSGSGDYLTGVTLNGVAQTAMWLPLSKVLEHSTNTLVLSVGPTATYGLSATPPNWRTTSPGGNAAPVLAPIADANLPALGSVTRNLVIADMGTRVQNLAVTATSSNPAVVPNGNLVLTGTGMDRTLMATAIAGGSTTITVTVSDGAASTQRTFTLTASSLVNTAPTISGPASATIAEDGSSTALALVVGDAETAAGSLVVRVVSGDTSLIRAGGLTLGGSGANRTLVITPVADKAGSTTVTVTVSDGVADPVAWAIPVTVTAITDAPRVDAGADAPSNIGVPLALNGWAWDPEGSVITANWSKVSGPGSVTFADATALRTSASFSAVGTYVLGLSAYDGVLSAQDTLMINVTQPGSIVVTGNVAVSEQAGTAPLSLARIGGSEGAVSVRWTTVAGTALAGEDFTPMTGVLSWAAGVTTAQAIAIPLADNTLVESDETFTVVLSQPTGGVVAGDAATVTVIDNEAPVVTLSAFDGTATEPGTDTGIVRATRVGSTAAAVTIPLLASGTGVSEASYGASVTIPAGAASADLTVTALDDGVAEGDKTLTLTAQPGSGYALGTTTAASVTLSDNEPVALSLFSSDAVAAEATTADTGMLRIQRLGSKTAAVTANLVYGGTAMNGTDYATLATSVTLGANVAFTDLSITPINDALMETEESVLVTLAAGAGYTVASPSSLAFALRDNEVGTVQVEAVDTVGAEPGQDTLSFRVVRTGSPATAITVPLTVSGTVTNGSDFPSLVNVSLGANVGSSIVTITPTNDATVEASEIVTVTAGAGTGYTLGAVTTFTGTIHDNDTTSLPLVNLTASDATAAEPGSDTGAFLFTRTPTTGALTVAYAMTGTATSGTDFTALSGSVNFADGVGSATVPVTALGDSLDEAPETVILTLGGSAAYRIDSTNSQATVTLHDDETPVVVISASDATAKEPGSDTGAFTLTRTGSTALALTVPLTTYTTGTSGSDFTSLPVSATIAAGATSAVVVVTALDDAVAEADETVTLALGTGAGYSLGASTSAVVTIKDNEVPLISASVNDAAGMEPSSDKAKVRFTRLGDQAPALTIAYAVEGTATAGIDYSALTGTVALAAHTAFVDLIITPVDDSIVEPVETVVVTPTAGAGYTPVTTPVAVSIKDNEAAVVTIAATVATTTEGSPIPLRYTVTRLGLATSALTIPVMTSGTAVVGTDVTALPGTLTMPIDGNIQVIEAAAFGDALAEGEESVILTLGSGSGYTLGTPASATATVTDVSTNVAPVVSAGPDANAITGAAITLTGTASDANGDPLTLAWAKVSGPGTVTFGSPAALTTTATWSVAGTYVVSLTANDGQISTSDQATIVVTDPPLSGTLAFQATAVSVGEGAASVMLTVTRTGGASGIVSATWTTTGSSALLGADIGAAAGLLTWADGDSAAKTITLVPRQDTLVEGDETLTVALSRGTGGVSLGGPATISITDDDLPVVSLTLTDATAKEPSTDTAIVTVTRTGPTTTALTIPLVGSGATADATWPSSAVIPAGASSVTVAITPVDDALSEDAESLTLTASPGPGYTLSWAHAVSATINDNDPSVLTLSSTDATANENAGDTGRVRITRLGDRSTALTVTLSWAGTAIAGTDYTALATSVAMAATSSFIDVVVTPINDAETEAEETVIATLVPGPGYSVGAAVTQTVVLRDNEPTVVTVAALDTSGAEPGKDTLAFRVVRVGSASSAITVPLAVSGTVTNGSDFTTLSSAALGANVGSTTVTITPTNDSAVEATETVTVTAGTGTGYTLGAVTTFTGSIFDNDTTALPLVSVTVSDATVAEPGDPASILLTRSPATGSLTIAYGVTGTATPGTDYAALSGSVTLADGVASAALPITVVDDGLIESPETVIVTPLGDATYRMGSTNNQVTVTIADDEAPLVTVAATDASAKEPASDVGVFTLTRSGATTAALTIPLTIGGTATSGSDFIALSSTATIAAGATTATITVTPLDDSLTEADETITVAIGGGAGYSLGSTTTASIALRDNEAATVTVSVIDGLATEPTTDTAKVRFTRLGEMSSALAVAYTVGGTATSGSDFTALTGTASITAYNSTVEVTITPKNDTLAEATETVVITPAVGTGYTPVATPATVLIQDNEAATVSITAPVATVEEDGGLALRWTITRQGLSTSAITVPVILSGTATPGEDATALVSAVTIPAGEQSITVEAAPIPDAMAEPDEILQLDLGTGTGYTPVAPTGAPATVVNDDGPVGPG